MDRQTDGHVEFNIIVFIVQCIVQRAVLFLFVCFSVFSHCCEINIVRMLTTPLSLMNCSSKPKYIYCTHILYQTHKKNKNTELMNLN